MITRPQIEQLVALLDFAQFQRMFLVRKAAVTFLAIQSSSRRAQRATSTFRCIAD